MLHFFYWSWGLQMVMGFTDGTQGRGGKDGPGSSLPSLPSLPPLPSLPSAQMEPSTNEKSTNLVLNLQHYKCTPQSWTSETQRNNRWWTNQRGTASEYTKGHSFPRRRVSLCGKWKDISGIMFYVIHFPLCSKPYSHQPSLRRSPPTTVPH